MTSFFGLSPDGGDVAKPPREDCARLLQHISRLSMQNTAVFIPGFCRNYTRTAAERAVVEAIAQCCVGERDRRRSSGVSALAPRRAVVVLVAHEKRARDFRDLLCSHTDLRVTFADPPQAPRRSNGSWRRSKKVIEHLFSTHDVVIARDRHALEELKSGHLAMLRISLIVFDEAQRLRTHGKAHCFSVIMREFYRCLTDNRRPRVLAIATVPDDALIVAPIEENLYVEFPSDNWRGPIWRCVQKFAQGVPNAPLVDVEHVTYWQRTGDTCKPDSSDYEILVNELGDRAVVCYENFLKRRNLYFLYDQHMNEISANQTSPATALHGLTPKVIALLHVLRNAYEASTDKDSLMAVVHAGHPVVAVALHAIISDLRGFDGIVCRVILGDEDSAKALERGLGAENEEKGWQGEETDNEAVDDFGSGDANVLIVASSNINCISRSRRPIPPCPFVIRFDGSLVNPDEDGGGGRCRVIVFKPKRVYPGTSKGTSRKRRREDSTQEVDAPNDVDDVDGDGERAPGLDERPMPVDSNSDVPHASPPEHPPQHVNALESPTPGLPNPFDLNFPALEELFEVPDVASAEAPLQHSEDVQTKETRRSIAKPFCEASREQLEHGHALEAQRPVAEPLGEATCELSRNGLDLVEPVRSTPDAAPSSQTRGISLQPDKKQKSVRFCERDAVGQVMQSGLPDGENIANTVRTASALVGPQVDGSTQCYLYGLRLQRAKDDRYFRSKVQEISNPGGLEDYGVILSRKLNPRDLNISMGDLGFLHNVNNKVGTVGLVFLGEINLTPTQIDQAQHFVAATFSSVLQDIEFHSFVWGKHLKEDRAFLRNYLVVPVIRKTSSSKRQRSRSPSFSFVRKKSRRIYSQSDRGFINWDQISATVAQFRKDTTKIKSELFSSPVPRTVLDEHADDLRSNLIYVICARKRILLAGNLRYDLSPLSYVFRNKRFALNADGAFKPDKHIASLVNTEEEEDPEGLTSRCPYLVREKPASAEAQKKILKKPIPKTAANASIIDTIDLTMDSEEDVPAAPSKLVAPPLPLSPNLTGRKPKRSTGGLGPKQTFSAFSNRKKGREFWFGRILQTHEDFHKDSRMIQLHGLDQALITTMDPPRLSMEHFIDTLRGTPAKKVLSDVVEAGNKKATWCMVPELCRVHPISIGAMFLPSCLMALERHVLLCELRDLFAEKVGVPVPLKLLAQAVTCSSVDASFSYERLEFLGDAVLKLSSTLRVFTAHPHYEEGQMHAERTSIISNDALRRKARINELEKFLYFEQQYVKNWHPPGCDREGRVVVLNKKCLADVVEALCGVVYMSGSEQYHVERTEIIDLTSSADVAGPDGGPDEVQHGESVSMLSVGAIKRAYEKGVKFLEVFGIVEGPEPTHKETLLSAIHSLHPRGSPAPTGIVPGAFPRDPRLSRPEKPWKEEFGPLEKVLGYKFKRRHLLLCALTHGSYNTESCQSFQRLEFLGDAVVDFCVVLYLYDKYPLLGPNELTHLKSQIVSNERLARVTLHFGLHKNIFLTSEPLKMEISRFEELLDIGSCAAPKVLGDIFESILGAILVDSGLEAAWNVSMKLLRETLMTRADLMKGIMLPTKKLEIFVKQTLQIRSQPLYGFVEVNDERHNFECVVKIAGKVVASARATSKKLAQLSAARRAHERLSNTKPGSRDSKLIDSLRLKAAIRRT